MNAAAVGKRATSRQTPGGTNGLPPDEPRPRQRLQSSSDSTASRRVGTMSFNPDKQRWTNEDAEEEDHLMAGFDSSESDGEVEQDSAKAGEKGSRVEADEAHDESASGTVASASAAAPGKLGGVADPTFFTFSASDSESLRRSEASDRALRPVPAPKAFSALDLEQLATLWIVDRAPQSRS